MEVSVPPFAVPQLPFAALTVLPLSSELLMVITPALLTPTPPPKLAAVFATNVEFRTEMTPVAPIPPPIPPLLPENVVFRTVVFAVDDEKSAPPVAAVPVVLL